MNYSEKQILFNDFLSEWSEPFNKLPFILKYIASYPELSSRLQDIEPIETEELYESQLEWISLLAQLDNPIETIFFKNYWVPFQNEGYDYFIDISSNKFSIFEARYFSLEPYRWYKKYLFKDLTEFLAYPDERSINLDKQLSDNDKEMWNEFDGFFKERERLGYNDKLNK